MYKIRIMVVFCVFAFIGCATITKKEVTHGIEAEYSGKIIDNSCVTTYRNNPGDLNYYTKEAALNCTIGYSLFSSTSIKEFDSESNDKIRKYLEGSGNSLQVTITASEDNGKLHLIQIK